jgi:hypothetical protein
MQGMQRLSEAMRRAVQATGPRAVRVRDAVLTAIDGTAAQRLLTGHLKPLPTYPAGAFATTPARIPARRTVGALFPQTDRLDDRLPPGWVAVALDDRSRARLEAHGIAVTEPGADGDWLRRHGVTWALLRPDRFVFACGRPDDVATAAAAWRRITPPARALSHSPREETVAP